jgi:hypothetical protein
MMKWILLAVYITATYFPFRSAMRNKLVPLMYTTLAGLASIAFGIVELFYVLGAGASGVYEIRFLAALFILGWGSGIFAYSADALYKRLNNIKHKTRGT